jgi:phosphatidylglycerol:prolipoprotein diacylglycerol transferase
MHPILFRLGSYTVYSYTVAVTLGIIVGTWLAHRAARTRTLLAPEAVLDAGFWVLVGGILGGRAGYVLANWAYFAAHLDRALAFTGGGLSWHGALAGAAAAFAFWFALRKRFGPRVPDWRDLADSIAPGAALGCALGWLGCLLAGAAYGAEAVGVAPPLSLLAADMRDIYGVDQVRFFTQPLMIGWCIFLWGLLQARRETSRGTGIALFLVLYALADFAVAFLRGDGTWRSGLWLSQWASLAEICVAIGLGAYVLTREDRLPAIGSPVSRQVK